MVRITFQLLLVSLLWSCSASPEDKWYESAANKPSGTVNPKADSLAHEFCTCMSGMLSKALGSTEFETMLVDLEEMVALPEAQRAEREAELTEKFAHFETAMAAFDRQEALEPSPCLTELKPRMDALGKTQDGMETGLAMKELLSSNCRVFRVMSAWEGEGGL